jgi:hypothetical protein
MKVALGSLHLSLVEAATRQIDAAIDALQSGQYDIAITLAGAAEGMIERDGSYMFVHLKNAPHVLEEFSQKEWINETQQGIVLAEAWRPADDDNRMWPRRIYDCTRRQQIGKVDYENGAIQRMAGQQS